jgi:hypothetical protein
VVTARSLTLGRDVTVDLSQLDRLRRTQVIAFNAEMDLRLYRFGVFANAHLKPGIS